MADTGPDPFAASGGGVYRDGGWKPRNMFSAEELAGFDAAPGGATGTAAPAPTPNTTPTAPAQTSIAGQAGAASTYSATPGAAPTGPTSNQGVQDVTRNSYLERATQPITVDKTDPAFRQQADSYAANVERQKRNYLADQAEGMDASATGAMRGQERMASERAGHQIGTFEAQLVGNELRQKRQEVDDALKGLYGMVTADQQMALQQKAMELDAELKRLGISSTENIAGQELGLKDRLGTGALNLDLMRLLENQRQFADTMGFNVADRTAFYDNQALQNMIPR